MDTKALGLALLTAFAFCFASLAEDCCGAPRCSHPPAHGGSFNVVGSCETGHAEAKVEGGTLKVWFTGSCCELKKPARLKDSEIRLAVEIPGEGKARELVLKAKPLTLAGEKDGDSSYFEGKADWLASAKKFTASTKLKFQGSEIDFKIIWPEGNDTDDDDVKDKKEAK